MTAEDIEQEIALTSWIEWESGIGRTNSYWASQARWRTIDKLRARKRFITHDLTFPAHEPSIKAQTPCVADDLVRLIGEELTEGLLSGSLTKCAKRMGVSKATLSRLLTTYKQNAQREEQLAMQGYTIKATGLKTGTTIKTARVYKGKDIVADAEVDGSDVSLVLRDPNSIDEETCKILVGEIENKFNKPDAPIKEPTESKGKRQKAEPKASGEKRVAKPKMVKEDVLLGKLPKTLELYKKQLGWTPAGGTKEAPIKAVKFCLCGCGTIVERNFLPGHDARFKGQLIRTTDKNRNAIMTELGWDKYITKGSGAVVQG